MGCGINGTRVLLERAWQAPTGIVFIVPVCPKLGTGVQRVKAVLGKVPNVCLPSNWLQSIMAG